MAMKQDDKAFRYVLKHYESGTFDERRAFRALKQQVSIPSPWLRLRRWGIAAASVVALALMGGTYVWQWKPTHLVADSRAMVCVLPDGTQATLAPHSSLTYRGMNSRRVSVEGKVFLEVKHDSNHPFEVVDDAYELRDVGTAFMVDETSKDTYVMVTEGEVLFGARRADKASEGSSTHQQGAEVRPLSLKAGQGAVLFAGKAAPLRLPNSVYNDVAWATHRFHFDDTPLDEVLKVLSAYYHVRLTTDAPQRRLTADLHADGLDKVVELIERSLDVKVEVAQ